MVSTSLDSVCEAVLFLMDSANYPIYIHCNHGKHRTGCIVACLRKVQGWSVDEALLEYHAYAGGKSRPGDVMLIKAFRPDEVFHYAKRNGLLADILARSQYGQPYSRRRNDSTITDIASLRAALESGMFSALDTAEGSESSLDFSLSPTPENAIDPILIPLNPRDAAKGGERNKYYRPCLYARVAPPKRDP